MDTRLDVGDGVDYVVRTALFHTSISAPALGGLLFGRQRLSLLKRQAPLVAADGKADGPHAGVQALCADLHLVNPNKSDAGAKVMKAMRNKYRAPSSWPMISIARRLRPGFNKVRLT